MPLPNILLVNMALPYILFVIYHYPMFWYLCNATMTMSASE